MMGVSQIGQGMDERQLGPVQPQAGDGSCAREKLADLGAALRLGAQRPPADRFSVRSDVPEQAAT